MITPVNSSQDRFVEWLTGAAIKKGQIVILDTTAKPAAEGVATTIILGVAAADAASGATVKMYHPDQVFAFDVYQGGATDACTAAMLGTAYDIYVDGAAGDGSAEGEMYLDLNDTTGAFVHLIGYDKEGTRAYGRFIRSLMLI